MIETLSQVWAAGEVKTFMMHGKRFEILDAQYPCDVYLLDKSGAQITVMRAAQASFFVAPEQGFDMIQIVSAQAQTINFFVGSGDAGTRRISSTVQVVDGGRARTIANAAFQCSNGTGTAAAQYAQVVLWNPNGSGVRAVVKEVSMVSMGAMQVYLGPTLTNAPTAGNWGYSKNVGGANSKLRAYTGLNATQQITTMGAWETLSFGGAGSQRTALQEPYVLPPGAGVMVEAGAVNIQIIGGFEYTEESLA